MEAADYLKTFKQGPRIVIPGNHDVPLYRIFERIFNPYGLYKKYINPELDFVVKLEGATFVGLNSTAPLQKTVNGVITDKQLDFCKTHFERAQENTLKVVVLHHHLVPTPDFEQSAYVPDARRILSRFSQLGVQLVLAGHAHRGYVGSSLDAYHSRESQKEVVIVQCGTSTSRRGRGRDRDKNTFNIIEVQEQTIKVLRYLYIESEKAFMLSAEYRFPRPGQPYLAA